MLREGATNTVGNLANCWFIWRNSHDGSKPEPTDFPEFFANSDAWFGREACRATRRRTWWEKGFFLNLKLVPIFCYSHHFSCIIIFEWSMICLLGKNQVTNMTSDKGADLTNYLFDPRKNGVIPFFSRKTWTEFQLNPTTEWCCIGEILVSVLILHEFGMIQNSLAPSREWENEGFMIRIQSRN